MYSYIKGMLADVGEDSIVVEAGGVGYQVYTAGQTFEMLPPVGEEVKVYTYFQVREDAMLLYGFLTKDDLEVFKLLIGVSGIGPKGALAILSGLTADGLRLAVLGDDAKAIAKAPGVGQKTAQRLILELKDKLKLEDAFPPGPGPQAGKGAKGARGEAIQALVALGYSSSEALGAVNGVKAAEDADVEDILKEALKNMAFL